MQLPKSNCSYRDLNYTFILENEQGHLMVAINAFPSFDFGVMKESLALSLKENAEYFLQLRVTVNSQTVTSQNTFSVSYEFYYSHAPACHVKHYTNNSIVQISCYYFVSLFLISEVLLPTNRLRHTTIFVPKQ